VFGIRRLVFGICGVFFGFLGLWLLDFGFLGLGFWILVLGLRFWVWIWVLGSWVLGFRFGVCRVWSIWVSTCEGRECSVDFDDEAAL